MLGEKDWFSSYLSWGCHPLLIWEETKISGRVHFCCAAMGSARTRIWPKFLHFLYPNICLPFMYQKDFRLLCSVCTIQLQCMHFTQANKKSFYIIVKFFSYLFTSSSFLTRTRKNLIPYIVLFISSVTNIRHRLLIILRNIWQKSLPYTYILRNSNLGKLGKKK